MESSSRRKICDRYILFKLQPNELHKLVGLNYVIYDIILSKDIMFFEDEKTAVETAERWSKLFEKEDNDRREKLERQRTEVSGSELGGEPLRDY